MTTLDAVGRWAEDANGRLRAAAMQLYAERGFEETTVAEIAARAGVTARTFFRHFADKREVLFAGASQLQDHLVAALEAAPATATPMQAVGAALDKAGELLGQHHEHSRQRQAVINSYAELRERELIKMSTLAAALAAGLRRRAGTVIRPDDLPEHLRTPPARVRLTRMQRLERETIVTALAAEGGNKLATAESLGISRSTLYRKLEALGL